MKPTRNHTPFPPCPTDGLADACARLIVSEHSLAHGRCQNAISGPAQGGCVALHTARSPLGRKVPRRVRQKGYPLSSCLPLLSGYSLRTPLARRLCEQVRIVRHGEPELAKLGFA